MKYIYVISFKKLCNTFLMNCTTARAGNMAYSQQSLVFCNLRPVETNIHTTNQVVMGIHT